MVGSVEPLSNHPVSRRCRARSGAENFSRLNILIESFTEHVHGEAAAPTPDALRATRSAPSRLRLPLVITVHDSLPCLRTTAAHQLSRAISQIYLPSAWRVMIV